MIPTCIASGHVIAVISKNVTATQANAILHLLTHDVDGEPVGNAVAVTSAQLLLMHLPMDVLNYVPLTGLQSSPTGDAPKELLGVIFGTVMSAVDFLVNSIIDLGTFMLDVLVTIAEAVLAFYAGLVQAAADAVRAVVDVIVDAFLAFVDWVIEFATSVFNSLIAPFIDYISDAMHSVYASIKSASISIIADLEGGAQASSGSINEMSRALFGDLLFWIVGISVVVNLAIFAMRGMTLGAGFLISICLTVMAGLVVTNIIGMAAGSYDGSAPQDGTNGVITNWIESIFLQAGKSPTDADQVVGYLNSFWCVIELIPAMVLMEAVPGFTAGIGLAVTIFSIIIGFYAIADHDARLSAVGLVLGVIGALESLFGEAIQALSSELIIFTRLISLISIGFITINLIWTVI